MAGQICAATANFSTWKMKSPLQPGDFFGTLRQEEKPAEPIKVLTVEEQSELMMARLFGTTKEKAYRGT